jgi:YidC/Oxa1 family membrane protein insertase
MDKKQTMLLTVICAILMAGWFSGYVWVHKHKEWYPEPEPAKVAETQPTTQPSPELEVGSTTRPVAATQGAGTRPVVTAGTGPKIEGGEPVFSAVGYFNLDQDGKQPYPVGLKINPVGAALDSVTLNRFKEYVGKPDAYAFQGPYMDVEPQYRHALATRGVMLNGAWVDLSNTIWQRVAEDETSAAYQVKVEVGGKKLTITKRFTIQKKDAPSGGYEVGLTHEFHNDSNVPVKLRLYMNGPNMPAPENTRDIPSVVAGYDEDHKLVVEPVAATSYSPSKGEQLVESKKGTMMWVGVSNAYFDAIVRPTTSSAKPFESVKARGLKDATEEGVVFTNLTIETPDIDVAPGAKGAYPTEVYLGPKWREVLKTPYYIAFPKGYDGTLVLKSGMCSFCTFDWLINALVGMLWFFHGFLRDWGLAIILLVLIVRLCLHPITKRSQVSMSKMSKMGPEIERLKKKYKDEPDELNKAMMQFYKQQGATPILGCLPMFLQMPIWIALWSSLQSTFELRQAPFLWGYTWIKDLAQPDRLIAFGQTFSIWKFHLDGINVLPILLAGVFFIQQKFQPKPVAVTPEQAQQQKMMQWMSLLFPIFLYSGPSGLNLYILTSTAIGIWESKRIRDHIKEREEKEKQLVIIDAPEEEDDDERRPGKGGKGPGPKQPKKPGGLGGWLAELQQKAEELRGSGKKKR